jgi:hypothetical protein
MKPVPLTQKQITLVDDADYDKVVAAGSWYAQRQRNKTKWYAAINRWENGKSRKIYLHRFLMNTDIEVDHVDGNGLNNQRYNLRECTRKENNRNKTVSDTKNHTIHKGVYWIADKHKWRAIICVDRKNIHLGYFVEELSAVKAYDDAALKHFGAFACTNK